MLRNNNVLELSNPENVICQITDYRSGHSNITIVIRFPKSGTQKILKFWDVKYVEAPIVWQGANFIARDFEYSLKFARSLAIGSIGLGDYTLYEAKINSRRKVFQNPIIQKIFDWLLTVIAIFTVAHQKHIIRILASHFEIANNEL